MKLRIFEAFSGYGSQSMALERLKEEYSDFDYEVVGISEIDKYAIQAYNAVHGGDIPNFGDISKIDWNDAPDFDLLTYSFPCTDISSAGQQRGLAEGSGTRSSLLWECKKAIEAKKPKYLLMENVKALTQKKFLPYLHEWEKYLGSLGYTNFTKVLNAKHYGVPQNRERVFMVSVLGDAWYEFPEPFALDKRLKDVLEKGVDEKYYLSKKAVSGFENHRKRMEERGNGFKFEPTDGNFIKEFYGNKRLQHLVDSGKIDGNKVEFLDAYNGVVNSEVSGTITTRVDASNCTFLVEPKILQIGNLGEKQGVKKIQRGRVQENNSVSSTLTVQGEPPCYYEGVIYKNDKDGKKSILKEDYERNTAEILSILRKEIGKEENKQKVGRFISFLKKEILRQNVYEKSICTQISKNSRLFSCTSYGKKDSLLDRTEERDLRDMRFGKEYRRASQGWELSKQLLREFNECMSFVPPQITQKAKRYLFYMWKTDKRTWILQQTLYSLEKIWESSNLSWQNYRVRKLTEREVFRLMGVSDSDIDKIQSAGISKTQQYKLAGNSIVVDVLYYIFANLFINKTDK